MFCIYGQTMNNKSLRCRTRIEQGTCGDVDSERKGLGAAAGRASSFNKEGLKFLVPVLWTFTTGRMVYFKFLVFASSLDVP